jgi:hypothetical protein
MDIKYLNDRISHSENEDRLVIVISGKINKVQVTMLTIWIGLWTFCGAAVITQILGDYSSEIKLTLLIYLAFWGYFEYKIGYALFWRLWGSELIKIDSNSISIKKDIKGYGKVNTYLFENIDDLQEVDQSDNTFIQTLNRSFWSISEKALEFKYFNKRTLFGIQLSEKETKMLLSKMKAKVRNNS